MSPPTQPAAIRVSPFVLTWPRIMGISLSEMARASGVPLTTLESSTELSYEQTMSLWDALESLSADPVVGLHAGAKFTIDQMGVVGPALAHATHLDAALDVLVRIMGHFAKNAGFVRVDTDLGAGIAYKMPTLRSRHGPDTVFAAAMSLMRHCTGVHLKAAALDHQMPRCQPDEYAKHFGVAARWDQPISQLIFAKKDLSLPFRGASPQLAELLVANVPRLMSPDAQTSSFEQELEQAFWSAHQHGEATLETAAEVLGTSARTLQRRLGTMGTTFAEQRAVFLQRRAMTLLREDTTPIEAIAERLGYGSRAAFERAFMRWTGKTPHAARLEAQQG